MYEPDRKQLAAIVRKHFENLQGDYDVSEEQINRWINTFLVKRDQGKKEQLATDQLLNALFMVARNRENLGDDMDEFINAFLLAPLDRPLSTKPTDHSSK